jgi:membrane protein implicated in regulation of membrane protease activity
LKELEEKSYRELKRLEEEHHEQLDLLDEDSELTNLREKKLEADEVFEELSLQTGRRSSDIVWDIPREVYGLIIFLVGIAEVAATYNAFLGFEEPPLTTWAWAIGVGLVMAVLSHFNGMLFAKSRVQKGDIWRGLLVGVIAVATIVVVAMVRTEAMDEEVTVKHISLPAFIAISLAIYIVGVLLSYLSHDSNNRFYRALKNREKLQEQVHQRKKQLYEERAKLQKQLQEKERAINDAFEEKRSQIVGQAEEAANLLRDAMALHDEILQGARNIEKMISQVYKECIEKYRQGNAETRNDPEPVYWSNPIADLESAFDKIKKLDPDNKNPGLWNYN